jgi:hypothetical protein
MPNWRLAPRVAVAKARRPRRRGRRWHVRGWWQVLKFAWLLNRYRRRRSSPPVGRIVVAVVGAGLAITVIGAVTRRAKRTGGAPAAASDDAQGAASAETTTGNDSVASESTLTDRVQSEMFRRSGAPASATGLG